MTYQEEQEYLSNRLKIQQERLHVELLPFLSAVIHHVLGALAKDGPIAGMLRPTPNRFATEDEFQAAVEDW